MDIILLERIEKLGTIGDLVTVKDGYARNFLLPNNKALRANDANRKVFEANRERIEEENASKRTEAEKLAKNVEGTQIVLIRASSASGQLYGSVSVRDVAEALQETSTEINKSMIVLERPIKTLGVFNVRVALHPEVSVKVEVNVARSPEEAELQKDGVDVMAAMFDGGADTGFVEKFDPNAEPGEIASLDDDDDAPASDETDAKEDGDEA